MHRTTWVGIFLIGSVLYVLTVWQACAGLDPAAAKKLIAQDIAIMDYFGSRVSLAADGNTALIGASLQNGSKGVAYIFTRSNTGWTQQVKLTPTDSTNVSLFGFSVSLSNDGKTALIGTASDAAYIFSSLNNTWTQQAKLISNEDITWNGFGRSVALSGDGNTALIGDDVERAGYVFMHTNTTWSQQVKLSAESGIADGFGTSVSLANDGNIALIGASFDNQDKGAAYVFTRTNASSWSQQAKLSTLDGQDYAWFGNAVTLSSDGSIALIGASWHDGCKGAAYVFAHTNNGWSQQALLTAADGVVGDTFGSAVSLAANGSMALISSPGDDDRAYESGAVYVFTSTGNGWTQQAKLTAQDGAEYDKFGMSVSLAANGDTALIGAPVTFSMSRTGAAYVLTEAIPSTPTEKQSKPWLHLLLRKR